MGGLGQYPPAVTRWLGAGAVLALLGLLLLAAGVPHLPPVLTGLASVAVFVAAHRAGAGAGPVAAQPGEAAGTGASEPEPRRQL